MTKITQSQYDEALEIGITLMEQAADLEPTSALKAGAFQVGIPEGDELFKFMTWANKKLFGSMS
jgi:hypothetical protein